MKQISKEQQSGDLGKGKPHHKLELWVSNPPLEYQFFRNTEALSLHKDMKEVIPVCLAVFKDEKNVFLKQFCVEINTKLFLTQILL